MQDEGNPQEGARPILMKGSIVGLALMRREDVPIIARWNQDLGFTARLGTPGEVHTLEQRYQFFEQNSRWKPDGVEFAVLDLATGVLIGFGGLFDITRALVGTIFIGIGEASFRGRGCGREACRLICEYGFFFCNLHSIIAEVHAYNHSAIQAYEHVGFKHAGRLRGANLLNGRRYDEVIMDLVRGEFEPRHLTAFRDLEQTPM
jgi:RimJ/RimL family protein N-acetyltransferase